MEQIEYNYDEIMEVLSRIEAQINKIHDELDKLGVPKIDRDTGEYIEEDNDNNSGDNTNDDELYIYDINRSK